MPKVKEDWRDTAQKLNILPGYDTFRDAGDCYFCLTTARKVVRFFSTHARHVKGEWAGTPLKLELWQKAWLLNLLCWMRPDGSRRYRFCFTYVPRKNGKSIGTAGLGLYLLTHDGEPGAEIYCAAAEREQASLVYNMAVGMVNYDEKLTFHCKPYATTKTIVAGTGFMKALSAEAYSKHGFNAHAIIIDELHTQPNSELVDVLETSRGARRQPIVQYITTADYMRQSICNTKYDYACRVRDGILRDAEFLPVIYETLPEEDWKDPEVWKKANPNYGISIFPEYLQSEFNKAIAEPTYENTFKRLYLNIRTEQDIRYIAVSSWLKCGQSYEETELYDLPCFLGFDGSSTQDITAAVLYFPSVKRVLCKFWCPAKMVTQKLKTKIPYQVWAEQGFIRITEGDVVDYDLIRDELNEWLKNFHVVKIGIDPKETTQLQTQLASDGYEVYRYLQNHATLNAPTKELEKLVISQEIQHNNNQVLNWMVSNASVEFDSSGTLVKISKKMSSNKIDGVVALIMALGMSLSDVDENPYSNRGFVSL